MTTGHLASLGFGHPEYTTDLDEFPVYKIEKAFRKAFGRGRSKEKTNEMWNKFFNELDPYGKKE